MSFLWYIHSMIINGPRPFKQRTRQGLTIAPMKSGRWVLRVKSSLSAKRVKTDPVFKPLMEDAGRMKVASPLASGVYRALEIKDVRIYRQMVGRAKGLLKAGVSAADIELFLIKEFGPVEIVKVSTGKIVRMWGEIDCFARMITCLYRIDSTYISSA